MVAYSRSKRRAAPLRRRRVVKRRRTMKVPKSMVSQNIMMCKRKYYFGVIDIPLTSWFSQAFDFRLSYLPNYTEFTNLFDQYKINAVKIDFVPSTTGNDQEGLYNQTGAGGAWFFSPIVYTLIDKDGNPQVSTQNATMENSKARLIKKPFEPFSIYVRKPQLLMSAGLTTSAIQTRGWIDTTAAGAYHHGAAIAGQILNGTTAAVMRYYCTITYYMAFRNAK